MSSPFLTFLIDCSAQANWIGYGRTTELLCEFLDSHVHQSASNQGLLEFFELMMPGIDFGPMPERLGASDLMDLCRQQFMTSEEMLLEVLCQYVDENNIAQNARGFFEDMVDYHRTF